MNNVNEFVETTLDFIKAAGKIAIDCQEHLSATLKPDKSIVTQADLNISKLFRRKIGNYLKFEGHGILDEEDTQSVSDFFNNKREYTWVIDPIDGSGTYYRGFPLWAIAVSLYRDFKPQMGAIYMPATKDLVYSDGKRSYHVKRAFSRREEIVPMRAEESSLLGKDIVLSRRCCDTGRSDYIVLDLYSTCVMSIYVLTNRSICQFFKGSAKFWDVAASIAIAKSMGLCFRNVENDRDFDTLTIDAVGEDWSIKNVHLMCNPLAYDAIKKSNLLDK
jgi:myo-inositol-1(or 4)-monophosphatase